MGSGKAGHFVVDEAGGFSGVDHVDFADVFLALGIHHPHTAILRDGVAQRAQVKQKVEPRMNIRGFDALMLRSG